MMTRGKFWLRLAIVALATILLAPTTALAADWGPRTSTYNGIVRVEGQGTLTRVTSGSRAYMWVKDRSNDGNAVYGNTRWYGLKKVCTEIGISKVLAGTNSVCESVSNDMWQWESYTSEVSGAGRIITKLVTVPWCDEDGTRCANYGFRVKTQSCAQMQWPVPDSCTKPYIEYHEP